MHEMGIAESVLSAVKAESVRRGGVRVLKVGLKVGELSGVDPDALCFCLEALVKGTDLEPLPVEVEFCPRLNRCGDCGRTFVVVDYNFVCPACGSIETHSEGGDELQIAWLEIEEQ